MAERMGEGDRATDDGAPASGIDSGGGPVPGDPVVHSVADPRGVRRVVLDRPGKLNALSDRLRRELHDCIDRIASDPSVRVVSIEGRGRAFSAGADLSDPPPGSGAPDWASRRHGAGAWQRLLDDLEALPQPTVARLHGHVVGGAMLLAAACDIRIAARETTFRIPELALGIPLSWGGNPRLVREIGLPAARDLVMTGRAVDADEAHRLGLVQRVVPAGELDAAHAELIDSLLAMPDGPMRMTKAAFAAMGRERLGSTAWSDADLLWWSLREPEAAEAARRYLERGG